MIRRINDLLAACKCSRLCVKLHSGSVRVYIVVLAKFEFST